MHHDDKVQLTEGWACSLRAIVRGTLAVSPPSVAAAFTAAARQRLVQVNATAPPSFVGLFTTKVEEGNAGPSLELMNTLTRIRALYGAGLGFASLRLLAVVVRATIGIHWEEGNEMEHTFASIDSDVSQAIQSAKEEVEGDRVSDMEAAREAVHELRSAVQDSVRDANGGGGGYHFEQGELSLRFWKI